MSENTGKMSPIAVSNYDLHECIGRGGFGEVYRAGRIGQPAEFLAIKLLTGNPFGTGEADRFGRECAAMMKLAHRAVVRLRDFGVANGVPFIVTEYVDGAALREAAVAVPFVQRVSWMVEILSGLQHVHDQEILHRDVKPSNIMVRNSDRQPILLDFGLAYVWDSVSSETLTSRYVGSLGYIPAEVQANPRHRSVSHDVFSVAVTLYEILTGRRPVADAYAPLMQIDAGLTGLDPILQRALGEEQRRHPSATEFASDLRAWLSRQQSGVLAPSVDVFERVRYALAKGKQSSDEAARQRAVLTNGYNAALQELGLAIEACAKAAMDKISNLVRDVHGKEWTLRIPVVSRASTGSDQVLIELVSSGSPCTLSFARVENPDWPFNQGAKRPLLEWPQATLSRGQSGLRRPLGTIAPPSRACSPCWAIYDETTMRSPQRVILGGICAYVRGQDHISGVPTLEVYGRDQRPFARTPKLLKTEQDIVDYLFEAASASYGVA